MSIQVDGADVKKTDDPSTVGVELPAGKAVKLSFTLKG